jgi:hypothetical protein
MPTELLRRVLFRAFTDYSKRPSKVRFYSRFGRDVREITDGADVAADVASSRFKNLRHFRSDRYIGVDLDDTRLREGLREAPDSAEVTAVKADITAPVFHTESVDALVSTHTLSHLNDEDQRPFVERAVDTIAPEGDLILNTTPEVYSEKLESVLESRFQTVETMSYRNVVSELFEQRFQDSTGRISYPSFKPARGVVWLLSLIVVLQEFFPIPGSRSRIYVHCSNKL